MKTNNGDFIRGDENRLSSAAAARETHGMGADRQLTISEEDLCEYLVTKYQTSFRSLTTENRNSNRTIDC